MGAVAPLFAEHLEFKATGFENGVLVSDRRAVDRDFSRLDQPPASLARAEALSLQDALEGQLAHFPVRV